MAWILSHMSPTLRPLSWLLDIVITASANELSFGNGTPGSKKKSPIKNGSENPIVVKIPINFYNKKHKIRGTLNPVPTG